LKIDVETTHFLHFANILVLNLALQRYINRTQRFEEEAL
jgi:hypothetical protein